MITVSIYHLIISDKGKTEKIEENDQETRDRKEDMELPLFNLDTLVTATNDFSMDHKLGEGGFGPVYKVNNYEIYQSDRISP